MRRRERAGGETSMHDDTDFTEFVTFTVAGQMFGLPISRVQDVFKPSRITRVPLAGAEIAGVLNLRGRIATADGGLFEIVKAPARHTRAAFWIGLSDRHAKFDSMIK
jgi:CheW-like domain